MTAYWGFRGIAKRMGWRTIKPFYRYMRAYAFPAYKRVDPHNRFRRLWYSNEALVQQWEWTMVKFERERLLARQEKRKLEK